MTTGGLKPDISSRIAGFLLSGAVHLAVGLALFYASEQGVPLSGPTAGDDGAVLVVELIPLERAGGSRGDNSLDKPGPTSKVSLPPPPPGAKGVQKPSQKFHASGTATSDFAASSEERGDARQMADLPSSEVTAYRQRLESHLARYRVFPSGARSAGREGVVTIYFRMTQEGRVRDAWVEASSGVSDLDAEALAAILRAQPLPALPRSWPSEIDVSLPVTFRLG